MRGGADNLIVRMEEQTQSRLPNSLKLRTLLHWANQTTLGSDGDFRSAAKRADALHIALAFRGETYSALNIAHLLDLKSLSRFLNLDFYLEDAEDFKRLLTLMINLLHEFETAKIFRELELQLLISKLKNLHSKAPHNGFPLKDREAFAKRLFSVWLSDLQIQQSWVDLDIGEARFIENYFYANELIVRCKEAAVRVSPQVWAGIEERMLTVRNEG